MLVSDAAKSSDPRALLIALRDRVAEAIDHEFTPPRDLAALSRRLLEISKELETLDTADAEEVASCGGSGGQADAAWDQEAI